MAADYEASLISATAKPVGLPDWSQPHVKVPPPGFAATEPQPKYKNPPRGIEVGPLVPNPGGESNTWSVVPAKAPPACPQGSPQVEAPAVSAPSSLPAADPPWSEEQALARLDATQARIEQLEREQSLRRNLERGSETDLSSSDAPDQGTYEVEVADSSAAGSSNPRVEVHTWPKWSARVEANIKHWKELALAAVNASSVNDAYEAYHRVTELRNELRKHKATKSRPAEETLARLQEADNLVMDRLEVSADEAFEGAGVPANATDEAPSPSSRLAAPQLPCSPVLEPNEPTPTLVVSVDEADDDSQSQV